MKNQSNGESTRSTPSAQVQSNIVFMKQWLFERLAGKIETSFSSQIASISLASKILVECFLVFFN
jgi:hypothetical protein